MQSVRYLKIYHDREESNSEDITQTEVLSR
jgi:hypothetical protein